MQITWNRAWHAGIDGLVEHLRGFRSDVPEWVGFTNVYFLGWWSFWQVNPNFSWCLILKVSQWSGAVGISGRGVTYKQHQVWFARLCWGGPGCQFTQRGYLRYDQDAPLPSDWSTGCQIHRREQQEHPANPQLARSCEKVHTPSSSVFDLLMRLVCTSDMWFVITVHDFAWVWWSALAYHNPKE